MDDSGMLIFKTVARDLVSNKVEVSYGTQATSYYRNWAVESSVVGKIIFGKFEDIPEPVFNMMFGEKILVVKVTNEEFFQKFSLLSALGGVEVAQDNLVGGYQFVRQGCQGSWFAYNDRVANLLVIMVRSEFE